MSSEDFDKNKHENIAKTVFFRFFLGYAICQWSHVNAPHTKLTLHFLKPISFYVSWSSRAQSL